MATRAEGAAVERVTSALGAHGSRRRGKNWICPAHDDRHASLTVNPGDGKALIHCHAGCRTEQVLVAIGLEKADLFDDPIGDEERANLTLRQRGRRSLAPVMGILACPEGALRPWSLGLALGRGVRHDGTNGRLRRVDEVIFVEVAPVHRDRILDLTKHHGSWWRKWVGVLVGARMAHRCAGRPKGSVRLFLEREERCPACDEVLGPYVSPSSPFTSPLGEERLSRSPSRKGGTQALRSAAGSVPERSGTALRSAAEPRRRDGPASAAERSGTAEAQTARSVPDSASLKGFPAVREAVRGYLEDAPGAEVEDICRDLGYAPVTVQAALDAIRGAE